jgi:hypothetical protein
MCVIAGDFENENPLYHDAAAAAPPPAPLENARAQASELELRRIIQAKLCLD